MKGLPGKTGSGLIRSCVEYLGGERACPVTAAHWDNREWNEFHSSWGAFKRSARRRSELMASIVCWRVAWAREWRAIKIKSQPGSMAGISGRRLSRSKRFARFLSTAFPTDRPAATPKRESPSSFGKVINTISGWAYDLPNRRTRVKSDELDRRNLRST